MWNVSFWIFIFSRISKLKGGVTFVMKVLDVKIDGFEEILTIGNYWIWSIKEIELMSRKIFFRLKKF